MDKLRRVLSGDEQSTNSEEQSITSQFRDATTLNWSSRIQAFLICFILGFVFCIIGSACIALPRGLTIFAVFYTIGNISSLMSTMFLMGPLRQLKNMFNEKRIFATLLVFLFLILTLLAALKWHKPLLAVLFCMCQFLAFIWYSLSYIPFARDAVKKTITSCI